MTKLIQPITDVAVITDKETGEVTQVKYMKGSPRQYRFDAGKGILNIKGETPVTKSGKDFKIVPVGYRIFKDKLFGQTKKEWLELFFINGKGAICGVAFHGYSVQHFKDMLEDLFYEDAKVTECIITVSPKEKVSNKVGDDGKQNKYYIANFEAEILPSDNVEILQSLVKDMEIYRTDTILPTNEMISSENFPTQLVEAEKKANAEEKAEEKTEQTQDIQKVEV